MSLGNNDIILVVVDRLTKMAYFIPYRSTDTSKDTARRFIDYIFKYYGFPELIVSNRDP